VYFDLYTNDELFDILQSYLPNIALICDKNDISYACRGRARDAFLLSQNILRYCNMTNKNEFDDNDWIALKDIFGVHNYGLNSKEVELMKMIQVNQPISCNNLAIRLGINVENVESEIEIRPKELGFITNTMRGRCLTEDGLKFILTNK
jgi:Holliday junction resolvasome RuvABC ATP-dependent DNA helicase subunit